MTLLYTRDSIRWRLYSCDKSSYIRSVYNECHVVLLKCTEQNVNNKTLPKISQLYVHVFFCLKVIKSWLYLPFCGHGHVICMGDIVIDLKTLPVHDTRNIWQLYGNQMDLMFSEKPLRESAVMFFLLRSAYLFWSELSLCGRRSPSWHPICFNGWYLHGINQCYTVQLIDGVDILWAKGDIHCQVKKCGLSLSLLAKLITLSCYLHITAPQWKRVLESLFGLP